MKAGTGKATTNPEKGSGPMTNLPNLDKRRAALLNQARLLADAGGNVDQAHEITITAMASLGLRTVSLGRYVVALELFEQLAVITAAFDQREQIWGPWTNDVECGVVSPDWDEAQRILAESINDRLTHLISYGEQHGVLETVPSQPFMLDALFAPDDRRLLDSISRVLVARSR
jgi:hypothetical protein